MNKLRDEAVNAIIRPPRKHYEPSDLPLFLDAHDGHTYVRHPVNFSNNRNQKIVGSIYLEDNHDVMDGGPCAIYMHGNASSQLEGQFLVPNFCPHGVAVYVFDFAGCGESGGDYISLGYYEEEDVELLMRFLEITFNMGPFILWGRSMGAAVSVLAKNPKIVCRIVDSAYTSIYDLCYSIASNIKIPSFLQGGVIWWIKNSVQEKAGFDMSQVSTLEAAKQPNSAFLLIGHADDDEFVPFEQGEKVFEAYNGEKEFVKLHGGHNGRRPLSWIQNACQKCFDKLGVHVENFKAVHFYGLHASDHFKNYQDLIFSSLQKTTAGAQIGNSSMYDDDHSSDASTGEM